MMKLATLCFVFVLTSWSVAAPGRLQDRNEAVESTEGSKTAQLLEGKAILLEIPDDVLEESLGTTTGKLGFKTGHADSDHWFGQVYRSGAASPGEYESIKNFRADWSKSMTPEEYQKAMAVWKDTVNGEPGDVPLGIFDPEKPVPIRDPMPKTNPTPHNTSSTSNNTSSPSTSQSVAPQASALVPGQHDEEGKSAGGKPGDGSVDAPGDHPSPVSGDLVPGGMPGAPP